MISLMLLHLSAGLSIWRVAVKVRAQSALTKTMLR